jgi:hypothetical protein
LLATKTAAQNWHVEVGQVEMVGVALWQSPRESTPDKAASERGEFGVESGDSQQ